MADISTDAVRERLKTLGISAREASRRAGFHVGYVGDLLDGRSKSPDGDRVARLAMTLETSPESLLRDAFDSHPRFAPSTMRPTGPAPVESAIGLIPLHLAEEASDEAFVQMSMTPAGHVRTLPSLELEAGAYAVKVFNDLNAPRFFEGETVFVSRAQTPRPGDFVFIRVAGDKAGIARLVEKLPNRSYRFATLSATEGNAEFIRQSSEFSVVHKIVGVTF